MTAIGVAAYCEALAARLVQAGVRAVVDPGRVTVPCVLVVPQEAEFTTLDGEHARTAFAMHALAPGKGGSTDMRALSKLVAQVVRANVAPVMSVRLASYQIGDNDLPCFTMEWVEQVSWTAGL